MKRSIKYASILFTFIFNHHVYYNKLLLIITYFFHNPLSLQILNNQKSYLIFSIYSKLPHQSYSLLSKNKYSTFYSINIISQKRVKKIYETNKYTIYLKQSIISRQSSLQIKKVNIVYFLPFTVNSYRILTDLLFSTLFSKYLYSLSRTITALNL